MDADTVPALPIRTRANLSLNLGSVLRTGPAWSTPDATKVGSLKRWCDYTPGGMPPTTPAGVYPSTPAPGTGNSSKNINNIADPSFLFEKTPTPMDAPYYSNGPSFGFSLPTVANSGYSQMPVTMQAMPGMQAMPVMQATPIMQPVLQQNGMQQMMYQQNGMQQNGMQQNGMQQMWMPLMSGGAGPAAMSSSVAIPMSMPSGQQMVTMPSGQQMVMVAIPVQAPFAGSQDQTSVEQASAGGYAADSENQNANAAENQNANAGRQIFSEAMHPDALEAYPEHLRSPGSALHGTGRCQPCAWFWKPKGCTNAVKCQYCHLCPEGELKNRKKAKVTAMRMGALEATQDGAPVIRLTQLLGDFPDTA